MGYELRTGGLESLKDLAKEVYSFGPGHGSNAKYSRDDTLRQLIAKNRAVRRVGVLLKDGRPEDTPVPDVHQRKSRPTCN